MPIDPADVTNSNTDLNLPLSPQPVDYSMTNGMSNNPNAQANHFNQVNATDQDNFTYPVNLTHQSVQTSQQQNGVYPINLGGESFLSPAIKSIESTTVHDQFPEANNAPGQFATENSTTEQSPYEQMSTEQVQSEQLNNEQLPLMEVSTIAPNFGDNTKTSEVSMVDNTLNDVNSSQPEVVNLQTPIIDIQDVAPDAAELTKFADEEEEKLIHGIRHAHGLE